MKNFIEKFDFVRHSETQSAEESICNSEKTKDFPLLNKERDKGRGDSF